MPDRNYSVVEVAERLEVTTKRVYDGMQRYRPTTAHQQTARRQDEEIRQLHLTPNGVALIA